MESRDRVEHDVPCPYLEWEDESSKSISHLLRKQSQGVTSRGGKGKAAYEMLRGLLTVEGSDGEVFKREVTEAIGCSPTLVWQQWEKLRAEGYGEYVRESTGAFGSGAQKHIWRLKPPTGAEGDSR